MTQRPRSRAAAALLAASLAAAPAAAWPDDYCLHGHYHGDDAARVIRGYDPETGRDLWNYPPHPLVQYGHMKLVIDIPDMNTPRFAAVQTLTVKAINETPTLTLDAQLLDIHGVQVAGHTTTFTSDGKKLAITFDPPLAPGVSTEIVTTYAASDPPFGLTWTPGSPAWPGRPAQLHTQGQPGTNSFWFPCHDFPNVRLTTELVATVPAGFVVSSNGRMVSAPKRAGEGAAARDTFHWLQDKPHANYLASLIVGKFDVVDVAGRGQVPMPVYVPPGRGRDVPGTYGRTGRMVEHFAKLLDEPYPWDRYAQLVVWNFGAGGMENTSATTMYDTAILTSLALRDGDLDGLISHELAHQWFGDLITCRSWEHTWLNEGFATYLTQLWFEERDGKDAYQAGILGNFDSVTGSDKAEAPYQRAMVSKEYKDPWETFRGPASPYPKGASILHMLRQRLGDDVFFRGIAAYVDRFKLRTVETNDLRRVLEEVSGENLERFFQQWCYRPGVPDLDIAVDWDSSASELVVAVKQTQNIDGPNPAFVFDLPVWVDEGARPGKPALVGRVEVSARETTGRFKLPAEPQIVAIDPDLSSLAKMKITQPAARWISQLQRGPTLAARIQAARALRDDGAPAATAALGRLSRDAKAHKALRAEAVRALAARKDAEPLIELSAGRIEERDVGVALAEAAGTLVTDESLEPNQRARFRNYLIARAGEDPSARVTAAAVRALGRLKGDGILQVLLLGANTESQHDQVRQAALEALGELGAAEGLAVALHYAAPGSFNRTRPVAIDAVAKLAKHDPEAAFNSLVGLLHDRESRAWRAAGAALVRLGDKRAKAEFERLAAGKRAPGDLETIREWTDSLDKAEKKADAD